jgi:hypothetical protein
MEPILGDGWPVNIVRGEKCSWIINCDAVVQER